MFFKKLIEKLYPAYTSPPPSVKKRERGNLLVPPFLATAFFSHKKLFIHFETFYWF